MKISKNSKGIGWEKENNISIDGENIDLSKYQIKSDNNLNTIDKTIVGAINEVVKNKINYIDEENIDIYDTTNVGVTANGNGVMIVINKEITSCTINNIELYHNYNMTKIFSIYILSKLDNQFSVIKQIDYTPTSSSTSHTVDIDYNVDDNSIIYIGFYSTQKSVIGCGNTKDSDIKGIFRCSQNSSDNLKWDVSATNNTMVPITKININKIITNDIVPKSEINKIENKLNNLIDINNDTLGEFDFSYSHNASASCFILNNKIYDFSGGNDDNTSYGYCFERIIDYSNKELSSTKPFRHNLGHINTVSYCEATDTLICGNGSDDYFLPNKIIIFNNFIKYLESHTQIEYSDALIIDVSNQEWGSKLNVIWGEDNNENYNIIYAITNDCQNIRKILLGKANEIFDGNYLVLESWVNETYLNVVQDATYYKGKIYYGLGHSGIQIIEATLLNNGKISTKQYNEKFYDTDGSEITSTYIQGIDLKDNKMVLATTSGVRIYKI